MKKVVLGVTVVIVLVMSLFVASFASTKEEMTHRTITIVDSAGRELELPYPLERVVVLNPPNAEIMRALGVTDRIVGISGTIAKKPGYWKDLSKKPVMAARAHGEPDYEKIVELSPQIVLTYGTHPAVDIEKIAKTLAPAGIKVVGIDCYKIKTLFRDITTLGTIFGKVEPSAELNGFFQNMLKTVEIRVKDLKADEEVRVYAEHHGKDYTSFGPGSEWHEMILKAGGSNIFADAPAPYSEVDPEMLIERNPEIILKDVRRAPKMGYGITDTVPMDAYISGLRERPGWSKIDAVKNKKIYLISSSLGAGPTKLITILYFAKIFHPELFADVDPNAMLQEYYERFQGVELKGIFIYPEK
ncbi:ABC transporter substrate-binding protein [Candidatus Aerophobetes bacterium]|nr:ABC transporter substrate-binding protein [Candidatus Aerophobetes bacterium]